MSKRLRKKNAFKSVYGTLMRNRVKKGKDNHWGYSNAMKTNKTEKK